HSIPHLTPLRFVKMGILQVKHLRCFLDSAGTLPHTPANPYSAAYGACTKTTNRRRKASEMLNLSKPHLYEA
ncbi:MAG: hypothetical protein K1V74_03810, partial [Muribaculaceae bacterium]